MLVSPAELLTASLLVTSLSSGADFVTDDDEDNRLVTYLFSSFLHVLFSFMDLDFDSGLHIMQNTLIFEGGGWLLGEQKEK